MTLLRQTTSEIANKNTDQNGRLKTNVSSMVFEANFAYSPQAHLFGNVLTSGGTVEHAPFVCGMNLKVTSTAGSIAQRLSYRHFSQLCGRVVTFSGSFRFPVAKTGIVSRFGMYDDGDGVFFEQNGADLFICLRSSTSGTVVETRIPQSEWNVDKLDGTGPSRIIFTKDAIQSLNIRFSNTGIGNVQIAFLINGERIVAHMFSQTNVGTVPLLRPISLPIQARIANIGGIAGSASTLFVGNCVILVDGPYNIRENARSFCCDTGLTAVPLAQGAWTPVASFRLAALKNGVKYRGNYLLDNVDILLIGTGNVMWRALINGTLSGTPSWAVPPESVGSVLERDMSATGVTGGSCILSGYVGTGGSTSNTKSNSGGASIVGSGKPVLYGKSIGANDTMTLAMRAMTTGMSVFAIMNHVETED